MAGADKEKQAEIREMMLDDADLRESLHDGLAKAYTANKVFNNKMHEIVRPDLLVAGPPLDELKRKGNEMYHFMVYALGKGVTIEEIMVYYNECQHEPMSDQGKEVEEKIKNLSNDFINGFSTTDPEKRTDFAINMYTDFFKAMELEGKKMTYIMANGTPDELNALGAIMGGVTQSALVQTLNLGNTGSMSEEQIKLYMETNKNLEGLGYKWDDISSFLAPLNEAYTTITGPDVVDRFFDRGETLKGGAAASFMVNNYVEKMNVTRQVAQMRIDREKENPSIPFMSDKDIKSEMWMILHRNAFVEYMRDPEVKTTEQSDAFFQQGLVIDPKKLYEKMQSNVRRNIFGVKVGNSDEYKKVVELLEKVAKAKEGNEEVPSNTYTELRAACKEYMDSRNPNSKDGKKRYGLVMLADEIAKGGLGFADGVKVDMSTWDINAFDMPDTVANIKANKNYAKVYPENEINNIVPNDNSINKMELDDNEIDNKGIDNSIEKTNFKELLGGEGNDIGRKSVSNSSSPNKNMEQSLGSSGKH